MRRLVLLVLAALCLTAWAAAFFLIRAQSSTDDTILPTLMVLPSLTPTETVLPTLPPTPTPTLTPTATLMPTVTPMPTDTATLATLVLEIAALMPGVSVAPTLTPFPPGTTLLSAPPNPVDPLPNATDSAPPFLGWYRFESDYPTIRYDPAWTPRFVPEASQGEYHRTETDDARADFWFTGEALRVRYVAAPNMGRFEIAVDGTVLDTIDAYADQLTFPGTRVYFVGSGTHLLTIRATGRKNEQSSGTVVGLDAVEVFRADDHTLIVPPAATTSTPTPEPQPAARIELVDAPPTVQPTGTPVAPRVITAQVVIAYDENGNGAVDPAEGVVGISVRVVETDSNQVIASGLTDARGYVAFQLVTDAPLRIVVPYFGKSWDVQTGDTSSDSTYTLLLTPGNQPGLIP